MGNPSFRIVTLSIALLMAASYGVCYIDALADSNLLGCSHSGDSTCTMWENDCCLTEISEAFGEADVSIPLRHIGLKAD